MAAPHPERRRIIALAFEGVPPREIARRTGVPVQSIYNMLATARRGGIDVPRFATGTLKGGSRLNVMDPGRRLRRLLDPPARARGLTVPELARRVLSAVTQDGLVDAVLDDEGKDGGDAND